MSYCTKCGAALEEGAKYCTSCGEMAEPPAPKPEQNKIATLASAFTGKLFLAICVLVTISTVFSFDVMHLLFAIFAWVIFAEAKNGKLNVPMMRAVSGTVFAGRIIYFVGAISLLLCAGVIAICALIIPAEAVSELVSLYDEIMSNLEQEGLPPYVLSICAWFVSYGIKKLLGFLAGALAVTGVYLLCLGILWGGIHNFTKELYKKAEKGISEFEHAEKCASYMISAGVIMAVFALFELAISFSSTVPALLAAATIIVGSVFVKKNFNE